MAFDFSSVLRTPLLAAGLLVIAMNGGGAARDSDVEP
jgi:hypothetical protein